MTVEAVAKAEGAVLAAEAALGAIPALKPANAIPPPTARMATKAGHRLESGFGSDANTGATGPNGTTGGAPSFEEVKHDTCADQLPLPIEVLTPLDPAVYCRGFSTPDTGEGSLSGNNLAQVNSVDVTGLANITTTVDSAVQMQSWI